MSAHTGSVGPPATEPTLLPLGRPIKRRIGRRVLPIGVLALALMWLAVRTNVHYFDVTSGSMEPTLQIGQRVAVAPSHSPQAGDIVVFHPPAGATPTNPTCGAGDEGRGTSQPCGVDVPRESGAAFVKRVVATPGEEIAIVRGHAVVDGVTQKEPYIAQCGIGSECNFPTPVKVPAGEYYVLGDNRGVSDDSRFWGPVPSAWIIGTVVRCSLLDTTCHAVH